MYILTHKSPFFEAPRSYFHLPSLPLLNYLQKVIVNVNKYESGLGVSKHIGCILCCQVQSWWLCFTGWATTNIEQVNHVWTPPALKPPDRIHICWVRQYIFSSENHWFIRPGNLKETLASCSNVSDHVLLDRLPRNSEQVNDVWSQPALKPPGRIHICWVCQIELPS